MSVTLIRRDTGAALTFDASPQQSHTPSVEVTTHPIAEGAEIADHAEPKNRRITVEGIVTQTPFVPQGEPAPDSPIEDAIEWLRGAAGQPLTLETSLDGTYEPVLLTQYPYTVDQVRRRVFEVELVQVRLAEARTVRIPARKEPTLEPAEDKGTQQADTASAGASFVGPDGQPVSAREKAAFPADVTSTEPEEPEQDSSNLLSLAGG